MKWKDILAVLAAISLPTALNVYLIAIAVQTLSLHGAAAAMADLDFYAAFFICGSCAVIISLLGATASWIIDSNLKKLYIAGFIINAIAPFIVKMVFEILWE